MERQLFAHLWDELVVLANRRPRGKKQYSDVHIVGVYLWAVLHDRPVCWACQEGHWPPDRPWLLQLPSPATLSRRLRTYGVGLILEQLAEGLRTQFASSLFKIVDSKPLVVGAASKDKDARRGYAAGEIAKGYKLCCLVDGSGVFEAWRLEPLNEADCHAAQRLLQDHAGAGYIVGDSQFDANALYQTAGVQGWQLMARPQKPQALALGHCWQSPFRRRGLALLANPLSTCGVARSFGQDLYRLRGRVERRFGYLGNFGGGLAPLPNWVRRPHRVVAWVQAKILIAMARDCQKHKHLAA